MPCGNTWQATPIEYLLLFVGLWLIVLNQVVLRQVVLSCISEGVGDSLRLGLGQGAIDGDVPGVAQKRSDIVVACELASNGKRRRAAVHAVGGFVPLYFAAVGYVIAGRRGQFGLRRCPHDPEHRLQRSCRRRPHRSGFDHSRRAKFISGASLSGYVLHRRAGDVHRFGAAH